MDTPATEDKTGDALKAQRFQMLEDIAKELEGDVVFPTCFDVTLRLRKVLNDPEISLPRLVAVLSAEPLISGKILHLANSVAYNPQGNQCRDLLAAIQRIGLQAVRSTALALAMKQLLLSKEMVCFKDLMANLWEHSVETACAAKVLARKYTRLNPEEALLAGLMHDLGAFHMLYRAAHYEELRIRPDTVKHLIAQWHEGIGDVLFAALGLDEALIDAAHDHDHPRPLPDPIANLADVVYVANLLAGGHAAWLIHESSLDDAQQEQLDFAYGELKEEITLATQEFSALYTMN